MIFTAELIKVPAFHGVLHGDLALSGTGADLPRRDVVYVFTEVGNQPGNLAPVELIPTASVRPDPDGKWSVHGLDPEPLYTAIAYDSTGEWAPAIQAGLKATVDE